MPINALNTVLSRFGPSETFDRLVLEVTARGLTIFADVDHSAGAAAVGLPLRPTRLVIFGNAKGGTPLMQLDQTMGIELPLKALVWQDEKDQTWVTYNDLHAVAIRHGLASDTARAIDVLDALAQSIVQKVTSQP